MAAEVWQMDADRFQMMAAALLLPHRHADKIQLAAGAALALADATGTDAAPVAVLPHRPPSHRPHSRRKRRASARSALLAQQQSW